jgi:hypothetical protein
LTDDYLVEINNRPKKWRVETNSEEDNFASEASQASQRLAFVRKDKEIVSRDKEIVNRDKENGGGW